MKTALVTGASCGIGAAIATALRARGFVVVGTSRRATADQAASGEQFRELDVTDPDSVRACVAGLDSLDLLVNNAGVMLRGAIEETSDAQAQAVFDTNFFGLARMTRACLPLLRASASSARIINIGSIAGGNALPLVGYYAASKHALRGFSEALRSELKPFGVDVCLVEPSDFRTRLFKAPTIAQPMAEYESLHGVVDPFVTKLLERAEDPVIVGRLVAELACARSTKLCNRVGTWGRALPAIKTLLPQRAFEQFMAKGLNLNKVARASTQR